MFTINLVTDAGDANLNDGVADVDLNTAGEQTTLRAAIEQANFTAGADIIVFGETLWNDDPEPLPTPILIPVNSALEEIGSDISLFGPTNPLRTIIIYRGPEAGANDYFRLFKVTSSGNLAVERVKLTGFNNGSAAGGAIYNEGSLYIANCHIYGNKGSDGGGVFTIGENSSAQIYSSSVYSNQALGGLSGSGGGICNYGSALTLDQCDIFDNHALTYGGGVFSEGILSVTSVDIYSNESDWHAGGLYIHSGTVTYTGGRIEYNSAVKNGGGIYHLDGAATFSQGTTVKYNYATDKGGGVYIKSGAMTFSGCEILANTAALGNGFCYVGNFLPTLNGGTISQGEVQDPNP